MKKTFLTLFLLFSFPPFLSAQSTPEEITKEGTISYYHENYIEAKQLFTEAAERGSAEAHYYLGAMHINGQGVPQNYQKAVHHFTLSAAKKHAGAQMVLSVLYIQGMGVPQNFKRAARLLLLSAKQNNSNAQEILGWVHQNGVGVEQNSMIAYALWNYVAAQGSEWARVNRNYALLRLNNREIYEAQELSLHIQKLWMVLERQNKLSTTDNRLVSHRRRS